MSQFVLDDTIVALATPEGVAGLAVVRISGPGAVDVAQRVLGAGVFGAEVESHRAVYSILKSVKRCENEDYEPIDQVLALPLLAPRSYTGEDTVELFCHGGKVVARQVVAACREAGARPATAGEFTRRAFLNGKMSLDQAEAVADLIHAESAYTAKAAVRQLLGGLNRELAEIEGPLLDLLTQVEGSLEFLDEEEIGIEPAAMLETLRASTDKISRLLDLAPAGRLLREGVHVALTGPVNVGKSSLFNALLEEDRAIVDDEAGTTRDVVTATVENKGVRFVFHDTAGLRSTAGRVEQKGMARTREVAAQADIVLVLQEQGRAPENLDLAPDQAVVIQVITKADLAVDSRAPEGTVVTSSADGRGLPDLWNALRQAVDSFRLNEAIAMGVVLNERHRQKLAQCRDDLDVLVLEMEAGAGPDVVGTMLSSILSAFGEISGRVFSEQLLASVFGRFCVGK